MTCLLKILLSERMDKLEYHPYLTKNSVCEVQAKFSALSRERWKLTRDLFFNARIPGEIGNEKQCNMAEKTNGFWRRLRTLSPVTEQKWDILSQLPSKDALSCVVIFVWNKSGHSACKHRKWGAKLMQHAKGKVYLLNWLSYFFLLSELLPKSLLCN